MRSPEAQSIADWRQYIRAAARLRLSIDRNTEDYRFQRDDGGKIFYILDANLVRLFLDPPVEAEHVAIFGQGDADYLSATAAITAEYLFSRELSGQYGTPPFISPGHAEDVADMIDRVEGRLGELRAAGEQHLEPSDARTNQLHRLSAAISASYDKIEALVQHVGNEIPRVARALFDDPVREARQINRLLNGDLLRPLGLHPMANKEVMAPDSRIVRLWEHRILAQMNVRCRSLPGAESRARRNAETLTQLLLLNDIAREAVMPTKFVLVTTDSTLTRAYARWFWDGADRAPSSFALRHPSQFAPILNSEQMSNGATRSDLIERTTEALDALFEHMSIDRNGYIPVMSQYVEGDRALQDFETGFSRSSALGRIEKLSANVVGGSLKEIVSLWQEVERSAVLLNAPLIRNRFEEEFGPIAESLSGNVGIQRAAQTYLNDVLKQLEKFHADLVVGNLINELGQPSFRSAKERTAVFVFLFRAERVLSSAHPIHGGAASNAMSSVTRQVHWGAPTYSGVERGYENFVIASCLALASQESGLARRYARRALMALHCGYQERRDSLRNEASMALDEIQFEIVYLEAIAVGAHAPDKISYFRSERNLANAVEWYGRRGDLFGVIRALAAGAGLRLTKLFTSKLALSAQIWQSDDDPIRAFLDVVDHLAEAKSKLRKLKALSSDAGADRGEESADCDGLTALVDCYLMAAAVFERMFSLPVGSISNEQVSELLAAPPRHAGLFQIVRPTLLDIFWRYLRAELARSDVDAVPTGARSVYEFTEPLAPLELALLRNARLGEQ